MARKSRLITKIAFFLVIAILSGISAGIVVATYSDLPEISSLERFSPPSVTRIISAEGDPLWELYAQRRYPVSLKEVPAALIDALLLTEDRRFYSHIGIDPAGIARAIVKDIMTGRFVEGGSTITQQLAKTLFLTREKTLIRKLKEAVLALQIERRYTKDEILEMYLNQIYLGSGTYGVAAAAERYFGKPVSELTLPECAMIAGLPKAPSALSPLAHPQKAVSRRNLVLKTMLLEGKIDRRRFSEAVNSGYTPPPPGETSNYEAMYFIDYIKNMMEAKLGEDRLYKGGLVIETTISSELQKAATEAVKSGLNRLAKRLREKKIDPSGLQAALIAIDVHTGAIIAMAGGSDWKKTRFNRALYSKRQPGSAFKPIIFAYAIEKGASQVDLILDAPVAFPGANRNTDWIPENFSRNFSGDITLRYALAHSKNIPAVRLLQRYGISRIKTFARELGITSPLPSNLTLALGSGGTTLLELTKAYCVFANRGISTDTFSVYRVTDKTGHIIWSAKPKRRIVMSSAASAIITDMLKAVMTEGTGKSAGDFACPVAGKTGTTNRFFDALFIGFSPSVAAGVWVGFDSPRPLGRGETGARAALPIWSIFMRKAACHGASMDFDIPEDTVFVKIDPVTGKILSDDSKGTMALVRKSRIQQLRAIK